jgi:hypothetical protein
MEKICFFQTCYINSPFAEVLNMGSYDSPKLYLIDDIHDEFYETR